MKKSTRQPITRASLMATATSRNARWIACLLAGTTVLGTTALAVDNLWTGAVDNNWNNAGNWSLGRVPAFPNGQPSGDNFDDAFINTLNNFPVVTASPSANPRDIIVGGAGGTGRVDQLAGTVAGGGGGNWSFIGREGGTGTYNLANTAAAGGALTGFGTGSGSLNITGRLYVGGNQNPGGGNGTLNINTTGTVNTGSDLGVGSSGGTGVVRMDAGTMTTGGWTFIGKQEEGETAQGGGNGTLSLSGGTITHTGSRAFVGLGATTGTVNISGGTFNNTGGGGDAFFAVGVRNIAEGLPVSTLNMTGGTLGVTRLLSIGGVEPAGGNGNANYVGSGTGTMTVNGASAVVNVAGELWAGQGAGSTGVITLDAGTINVENWVAIGRGGGTGTLNVNGGTLNKTPTSGGNFIVGASGPGTMIQTGGLVNVQNGVTWFGESDAATVTLNGGEFRAKQVVPAQNGSSTATVNLNGGILQMTGLSGGAGTETVTFNGTQVKIGEALTGDWISNLDTATLAAGGLNVNTNGFSATVPQVFGGTGGITKSGAGTLTLTGKSTYNGASTVNAGKLILSSLSTGIASYTVEAGAGIGVAVIPDPEFPFDPQQLEVASVTFGATGTSVDLVLDNASGNPLDAPLKINGAATLNGPVAVNVSDPFPEVGSYPVIEYGSKEGTGGSFVLGTLPFGVMAELIEDEENGVVTLNVTSVAQPRWDATDSGNWNDDEVNWVDRLTFLPIEYTNGNPVLFNDDVSGPTQGNVTITEVVTPSSVVFDNSTPYPYVIGASGGGKISGTTGLTKTNNGDVSLTTSHDYTGVTRIEGGTLTAATLANGGLASSIGAASVDPANLALAGGTLVYTGGPVTIDRGYSIAAANDGILSGIRVTDSLTIAGAVTTPTFGKFEKTGAGTLTLTNPGANVLAKGGSGALQIDGGNLVLSGGGTQTNQVTGDVWVGSELDVPATLTLNNTTLTATGWMAIGRDNGTTGAISNLTATGSTIQTSNLSTGFGGEASNGTQNLTLTDTNWTIGGNSVLGEDGSTTTNITLNGTSSIAANGSFQMALSPTSTVNMTINDSGSLTKTGGWFSIGNDGTGTLTVNENGSVVSNGDFNIADVGTSNGTLNVNDSATVTSNGRIFIGKGALTTGTLNQTGGTITAAEWISGARFEGSTGIINISGGLFQQMDAGAAFFIAEDGNATATLSGTANLNVAGNLVITNTAAATATFNLDGGTLTAKQIFDGNNGAGNGTFNFDGGILRARSNANEDFMFNLETVNVEDGGAIIDTDGKNIRIFPNLLDGGGGGGLVKNGAGILRLNGVSSYTGATQVNAGGLGGTGILSSAVSVAAGASLVPGDATGTLSVASATFAATAKLSINIDDNAGVPNGELETTGNLDITNATLELTGTPTQPVYIIARYGSLTGTQFASVPTLPPGYSIDYNYQALGQIAIVRPQSGYEDWIATYFPGETDPAIIGADADPDADGGSNRFEHALGGVPNDPTSRPKVFAFAADSSDGGTTRELLLTIAVHTGTPAFSTGASSTATHAGEGTTYTVQGSTDLVDFNTTVTPVAMVPPPVDPGLPANYEYRTFSLSGSDGLPAKGFMRVQITP